MSDPPPPPLPPSHPPVLPSYSATTTTTNTREFRKGNWTIQETLTLITAKKLDEERRSKSRHHDLPSSTSSKPGELRWKWVENYCWAHGCFRSQNQCNDKWDNLLRDYKKVKEYQSRSSFPSYWTMERQQRKSQNLPSNMPLEIFEALNEVVQRRQQKNISTQQQQQEQQQQFLATAASPIPSTIRPALPEPVEVPLPAGSAASPIPSTMRPALPEPVEVPPPAVPEGSESSGTESSEEAADVETKRRKVRNIGSSIMRSASLLAEAIKYCDEKKEKRHHELLECEQRRLRIEENRNEVEKQGITNLVGAITNLSSAIQSLVSDRT